MPTAILVLTMLSMGIQVGMNTVGFIGAIQALHHHTTSVVYHKVLKPVGQAPVKLIKGNK